MSSDQNALDTKTEISQIRQNLVDTAVNFLLNPAVVDKPSTHKTAFLKKKGLTDAEISLAYERAEKDPKYHELQRNSAQTVSVLPPPIPSYNRSVTFWSRLSRVSSSLVVLGVALYGAHYIYKNYIEPYIFGRDSKMDKTKRIEKHLQEATKLLGVLERKLSTLEERVECQNVQMDKFFKTEVNEYCPTPLALRELKVEISSVKSLLLNRHQFPALPKISPLTIPEWQLAKEDNTVKQNGEVEVHEDPPEPEIQTSPIDVLATVENVEKDEISKSSETDSEQSDILVT